MDLKKTDKQIPVLNQAINGISKHLVRGGLTALCGGYFWWKLDNYMYETEIQSYGGNRLSHIESPTPFLNRAVLLGTLYSANKSSQFIFKSFFPSFSQHSNSYAKLIGKFINDVACASAAFSIANNINNVSLNTRDYNSMKIYVLGLSFLNFVDFIFSDSDEARERKFRESSNTADGTSETDVFDTEDPSNDSSSTQEEPTFPLLNDSDEISDGAETINRDKQD